MCIFHVFFVCMFINVCVLLCICLYMLTYACIYVRMYMRACDCLFMFVALCAHTSFCKEYLHCVSAEAAQTLAQNGPSAETTSTQNTSNPPPQ